MDSDQIQQWLRTERLQLADFLEQLTDAEWAHPSLCDGWTVHDVLAHITSPDTVRDTFVGLLRARGNWDRMTADMARSRAARFTPAELLAQLRAAADSTRRAPGSSPADPLVDIIVHGQDIARPLGRDWRNPTEHIVTALEQVIASRFYGARKRLRGIRLIATDVDWSHGGGPREIKGPVIDLLLVATGRQDSRG